MTGLCRTAHSCNEQHKATDHGHPTAATCDFGPAECQRLLDRALTGAASTAEAEQFRGQMLTEMARMSVDDGLVMQIHPGSFRNHNRAVFERFGPDRGCDIPLATEYTRNLRALLNKFGNDPRFMLVLFTLDETTYARELAPIALRTPISLVRRSVV